MNEEQRKRYEELKAKQAQKEKDKESLPNSSGVSKSTVHSVPRQKVSVKVCIQFESGQLVMPFNELKDANEFLSCAYDFWNKEKQTQIFWEFASGEVLIVDIDRKVLVYSYFE